MVSAYISKSGTPCAMTDDGKMYNYIGHRWVEVILPIYSKSEQLRHDRLIDKLENEDREEEL